MTEYTLVFRRAVASGTRVRKGRRAWIVVRPTPLGGSGSAGDADEPGAAGDVAQVFVVPICSALGLDIAAYEHFLAESGVLESALGVLGASRLRRAGAVVTARKEVQALVMAAEVQHILDRMSA